LIIDSYLRVALNSEVVCAHFLESPRLSTAWAEPLPFYFGTSPCHTGSHSVMASRGAGRDRPLQGCAY